MRKISKEKWKKLLLAYRKSKKGMTIATQKECSRNFKNDLLDLFKMCYENHSDSCTITFEYPNGFMEIDLTFRAKKRIEDGNEN